MAGIIRTAAVCGRIVPQLCLALLLLAIRDARAAGPADTLQRALGEFEAGRYLPLLGLISGSDRTWADEADAARSAEERAYEKQKAAELGIPSGRDASERQAFDLVVKRFLTYTRPPDSGKARLDPARAPKFLIRDEWVRGPLAEIDLLVRGPESVLGLMRVRMVMVRERRRWKWAFRGTLAVNLLAATNLPERTRTGTGEPAADPTLGDCTDLVMRYAHGAALAPGDAAPPVHRRFPVPAGWVTSTESERAGTTAGRRAFSLDLLTGDHRRSPKHAAPLARPPIDQWRLLERLGMAPFALSGFARAYPRHGEATAAAQVAIGRNHRERHQTDLALAAFEHAARLAPGTPSALAARQQIAIIRWNERKEFEQAGPLVRDLQQEGALPREIALPDPFVVPRILYRAEKLVDFTVSPDGRSLLLFEGGWYPLTEGSQAPECILSRLAIGGKPVVLTRRGAILVYPGWLESDGAGMAVCESSGYIRVSAEGGVLAAKRDAAGGFTDRDVSGPGWHANNSWKANPDGGWTALQASPSRLLVLTKRGDFKELDPATGAVRRRIPAVLPPVTNPDAPPATILPLPGDRFLVTHPEQGLVRIIGADGAVVTELQDTPPLPWAPAANALACDAAGRVFAAREYEKTVAVYAPDGTWLRTFGVGGYGPKAIDVTSGGLLLVFDGYAVLAYDADGRPHGGWRIDRQDVTGAASTVPCWTNSSIQHRILALRSGGFLVATDGCVAEYDARGREVRFWRGGGRGNLSGVLQGPDGTVLVGDHRSLFRFAGAESAKAGELPFSTERMSPAWGLARSVAGNGSGVVWGMGEANTGERRGGSAYEWLRYDAGTKRFDRKRFPRAWGGSRCMAVTRGGEVWACVWESGVSGEPAAVRKFDAAGNPVAVLQSAPAAADRRLTIRPAWKPVSVERLPDGRFAVLDAANRRIVMFDAGGRQISEIPMGAFVQGTPRRLRVDAQGGLYVLSRERAGGVLFKL